MDDILGAQKDAHRLAHRDMDVIVDLIVVGGLKFSIRPRIEHLPVELFSGDADFYVRFRNVELDFLPDALAGESKTDKDQGGNNGPEEFQAGMAMRVNGAPAVVSAILIEEDNHQRRDQDEGGRGNVIDKVEERINASPVWGHVLRKPLHHEIS